uniref:Uncharacterized protein n=1 Tax=Kwoniella dejecticola CBS 10117 TaxID=1296121 RepID=A0A1A6AC15_9TREE|nr:uncharacterized protein I303_01819 [Kwoniella dejecticola CBS 10117]OBR87611.1 hypothetical protein I303_01819 [Kwoniella dejecticola CBS 10117]
MAPTTAGAVAIYDPNGPAAVIAFLVFGGIAIALWTRYFRFGKPRPKFSLQTIFGATFMALGFICRISRRNGINAWSWLFETLFILLSPCAFLAQIYGLVPRLATYMHEEEQLLVKGRALVILFVMIDITLVIAQLAGTALTITFGKLVPIGVKLAFFALYSCMTVAFFRRFVCLTIRSIYRVAEYTSGASSALAQSEPAFYILDSVPMLIVISSFLYVWPPVRLVRKDASPSTSTSPSHLPSYGDSIAMRSNT